MHRPEYNKLHLISVNAEILNGLIHDFVAQQVTGITMATRCKTKFPVKILRKP